MIQRPAFHAVHTWHSPGFVQIQAHIGSGGMGDVYRARDTRLGRSVAIKVLARPLASDPEWLARFEQEARLLASLNHPHIAQIYGFEEMSGQARPRLVMELVEGQSLADRIATRSTAAGRGAPDCACRLPRRSRRRMSGDHPSRPEAGQRPALGRLGRQGARLRTREGPRTCDPARARTGPPELARHSQVPSPSPA